MNTDGNGNEKALNILNDLVANLGGSYMSKEYQGLLWELYAKVSNSSKKLAILAYTSMGMKKEIQSCSDACNDGNMTL